MLPIKPSSQALIVEVARLLQPHFAQIREAWRRKMAEEFAFDDRVLGVLERLNLTSGCRVLGDVQSRDISQCPNCLNPADGCHLLCDGNFTAFGESLTYYGRRLAKLQVDTRAVARSLEYTQEICEPYWADLQPEQRDTARAALEALTSATFVTVSGAYFDTQRKESAALLAVLDAELCAQDLRALLQRVLEITTATFNATVGVVLLRDPDGDVLHAKAAFGFKLPANDGLCVHLGQGFSGAIAQSGEPDMLPDLRRSQGALNPLLRNKARALWGVPLKSGERVIGVLVIGFCRPYEWLPTERELMRAIADRSALAIERARITDALREREMQIAELSAHLLRVQEEERKRISRELHDETGQALMVIRLYLGMLENNPGARNAQQKVKEMLGVVDRAIEELRRIIARLSPLVLQELGLIAAIRKEAKDLANSTGIKARVSIGEGVGRLASDIEAAIYRVVQEALHNVARHARAKTVEIHMSREDGSVALIVQDDGIGMGAAKMDAHDRQSFGLRGMRERISMLGGSVRVTAAKGKGTKLEIRVPATRAGLETLYLQPVTPVLTRATTVRQGSAR